MGDAHGAVIHVRLILVVNFPKLLKTSYAFFNFAEKKKNSINAQMVCETPKVEVVCAVLKKNSEFHWPLQKITVLLSNSMQ